MSGHSKWHSIKHKKGAADQARGKLFAVLIRQIEVAARTGGGDPQTNATLRTMVQKARDSSLPVDTIQRAIKRGSGEERYIVGQIVFVRWRQAGDPRQTDFLLGEIVFERGNTLLLGKRFDLAAIDIDLRHDAYGSLLRILFVEGIGGIELSVSGFYSFLCGNDLQISSAHCQHH